MVALKVVDIFRLSLPSKRSVKQMRQFCPSFYNILLKKTIKVALKNALAKIESTEITVAT